MAEVAVETRETLDDNRFIVQSVSRVEMPSASGLRILKRAQTVTLLAREKTTDPYRIMAELPGRSQRLSPSAVRLSLEASGRDTVMPLRALSLSAHAENIHPLEADIVEALQAFEKQLTQESPEYALDFDGDRSYVSIPTLLYDSSHPLTYEVFATPRQKGGIVIGNGQFVRTPGGSGIAVQARYNAHWWNGNNFMPVPSKFPVALHSRTHLAATLEGATIRLFVNGQLIGSKTLPNSVNRKQLPISIGGSPYGDENLVYAFDGLIDEARVSKTIRYRDSFQVPEKLETDDSTMAHFQFRKGSGTKLFDVSGNDHHGEIKNATWVTGVAINRQAAIGLATYGTRVVPVLAKALENEDASVRAAVVLGIGQFTRPGNRLQELLNRSLNDPNKEVRDAAKEAFNRINEKVD